MNKIKLLVISFVAMLAVSCGDMYDSARKSVLNDLLLVDLPVYYLCVSNAHSLNTHHNITTFSMNPDGTLVPVSGIVTSPYWSSKILSNADRFILYAVQNNTAPCKLMAYSLGLKGDLTGGVKTKIEYPGPPYAYSIGLSPGNDYLHVGYAGVGLAAVHGFSILLDGSLVNEYNEDPSLTGTFFDYVFCFAYHPNKKYLYVGLHNNTLRQYITDPFNGRILAPLLPDAMPTLDPVRDIIVHPSGKYVYFISEVNQNIGVMNIKQDGSLSDLRQVLPINHSPPTSFAMDPSGKCLVHTTDNNYLTVFRINTADGNLIESDYIDLGDVANACRIHPNGRFIYAGVSTGIVILSLDPDNGSVSEVAPVNSSIYSAGGSMIVMALDIMTQKIPLLIDTKKLRR
ncbi:MAG: lactonase family protein [Spirochaetes bacterium]|jgi:6-phosphogluconolactonase (cycloisomerase 2 family)|nr:lactonase family protein [Spirochaetota bacterium]